MNSKILFVITKSNWGGAQKYVFELAIKAQNKGQEVLVVLGGQGELKAQLEKRGIATKSLLGLKRDVSIFKDFLVFLNLFKIYQNFKPQTIHLNSSKVGALGSLAGRFSNLFLTSKNRGRIIFTAHGWVFNEDTYLLKKNLLKFISFWTIFFSHQTIVLSQAEYHQVSSWPFCRKKIKIEPLTISEINFLSREEARSFLLKRISLNNYTDDLKIIGTIAELHKNKGLEYGLKALTKMKGRKFIWLIIGEGEEKNALEKSLQEKQLTSKVFLLGAISEAAKYLKAFDLFLLPSLKEGLPYVLLESEKAGLPILSTKVGGIPEFFDKKPNIIVEAKNEDKIFKALHLMLFF